MHRVFIVSRVLVFVYGFTLTDEAINVKDRMMRNTFVILAVFLLMCSSVYSDVVWSDEFNGPDIDRDIWTWDVGGSGFGNGQLEYNTRRRENSYIENGSLVLQAKRQDYKGNSFTSARMLTQGRFAFKYGSLEARIKLPDCGDGVWPAFWLMGNNLPGIKWPDAGEIDILEAGSAAGIADGLQKKRINCAIHFSTSKGKHGMADSWTNAPVDLTLDYHRYRMEWTPKYLKFFLDDVKYGQWDITPAELSEFHQPFFPILNIAVGGWNYVKIKDAAGITAPMPAKMCVDWIRLKDNAFTKIYLGADAEETGVFGVFTETTPVDSALVFGDEKDPAFAYGREAAVYLWNNMVDAARPVKASEGSKCWSYDVAAGKWFGMGVSLANFRNMKNYSDGYLRFDIRTTLSDTMKVGVKSSIGGDSWLPLGDDKAEFGFARDGKWHSVAIPLNRYANIDFKTIHQMFMIVSGSASASTTLSIDNVYWKPNAAKKRKE